MAEQNPYGMYYRRFESFRWGRGAKRSAPMWRFYRLGSMEGTHNAKLRNAYGRFYGRVARRRRGEFFKGANRLPIGRWQPDAVNQYWRTRKDINELANMSRFNRVKYRVARTTGRISAGSSLRYQRAMGHMPIALAHNRRYRYAFAAGGAAAAVGTAVVARKVYKRRKARRANAAHGYKNTPPQLTTAQRRQMARRRRRVRGRFA